MARESVAVKAGRLLLEGKVALVEMHGGLVRARVFGDHGVYVVERLPGEEPECSCPARTRACAHVVAVKMVVPVWWPAPPAPWDGQPL